MRREINREIRDLEKDGFMPCAILPKIWMKDEDRQKMEAHPDYRILEVYGAVIMIFGRMEDAPQR